MRGAKGVVYEEGIALVTPQPFVAETLKGDGGRSAEATLQLVDLGYWPLDFGPTPGSWVLGPGTVTVKWGQSTLTLVPLLASS